MRRERNYSIILSNHAKNRMVERSGINKKSTVRIAEKAYKDGISQSQATGSLLRYISYIAGKSYKNCDIRIFNEKVYVFRDTKERDEEGRFIIKMVTMLNLPLEYKKRAFSLQKRINEEIE